MLRATLGFDFKQQNRIESGGNVGIKKGIAIICTATHSLQC
jgi:hypothetical protein